MTTTNCLSPLNFRGLLARLGIAEPDARPMGALHHRKPIECWRCPECREVYEWEDEAEDCCAEEMPAATTAQPACPVCSSEYTSHRDAADCCLWKDLDAPTRGRIADAVEAGSTWAEELRALGLLRI